MKSTLFSTILDAISKTRNRSDIELSPACSPLNSEQNEVSLQFIEGILVTHSDIYYLAWL